MGGGSDCCHVSHSSRPVGSSLFICQLPAPKWFNLVMLSWLLELGLVYAVAPGWYVDDMGLMLGCCSIADG